MHASLLTGTLILTDRLLPEGAVVVAGEQIAWVGEMRELPGEWRDLPATRADLVAPGLVDIHIHGSGGYDVMSGETADLTGLAVFLGQHGTTSFLATTISAPPAALRRVAQAAGEIAQSPPAGAEVLGLHLEGPWLNPARAGAHDAAFLRAMDLGEVDRLQEVSGGAVKLVTLATETVADEAIDALSRRGIEVSAGHSAATYEEASRAFELGVKQVTHLFNAMPPLGHRAPGLAGAALADTRVYAQLILDGTHVHPAMALMAMRAKTAGRIILISDALPPAGLGVGRRTWDGRTVVVTANGVYLEGGPLAGSTLTMLEAVRNAANLGWPFIDAWRMGALNPAVALGYDRKGRLEPGADADILLLTADLSLTGVYCRGQKTL